MGWIAAAISGILAALSYPTRLGPVLLPDLGFLAYFCWVPLFLTVRSVSPRRAFALGFTAGLFHYAVSQFWLYQAIHNFGGLSPVMSVLVVLLLFLVLSAYFGLIFLLSQWVCKRLNLTTLWIRPFFWVAIEYLRHYWPVHGYPWSQMALSQGGILSFIQIGDIFGAFGITFLLVLSNEVLTSVVERWKGRYTRPALIYLFLALFLILGNFAYGIFKLKSSDVPPDAEIKIGIVQGNISQENKWDRSKIQKIIHTFREGTQKLEQQGAELILWPEASLPYTVRYDSDKLPFEFGNEKADLLLGAITYSKNHMGMGRAGRPSHNSAILLNSESEILDHYHKRTLVPFGEFVPYREILFFAKKMVSEVGDLQPGPAFRPIQYGPYRLGILICYEDIFPYISRTMVADGANALINITNDAWYGFSSAAYQHNVYSQLRSVANRRSLVRATNTGISSLIDRKGRVVWKGGLYIREDFLTGLPLYSDKTLYVKMGDVLPYFSLTLMGVLVVAAYFRRKRV